MSKLLHRLEGVRGRSILIYDRKCVISTKVGVGSFLTGNVSDGEKTIFYTDVVGIQFKKSGGLIGYLQFETGSVQMNNQNSNMFSENTFTFEHGKNGVTNEQMEAIYHQVCDIIEEIKYGAASSAAKPVASAEPARSAVTSTEPTRQTSQSSGQWICTCGRCNADSISTCACGVTKNELKRNTAEAVSATIQEGQKCCPRCGTVQRLDRKVCFNCGQRFDN